jgi:hypothetical protein
VTFNELNSVEHYIIHQLSGINLNTQAFSEAEMHYGSNWQYVSPQGLSRSVNEVLMEAASFASCIFLPVAFGESRLKIASSLWVICCKAT